VDVPAQTVVAFAEQVVPGLLAPLVADVPVEQSTAPASTPDVSPLEATCHRVG
jgi:putative membrane protein